MEVEITAKNNLQEEREVVKVVEELLGKYDLPIFTKKIQVEKGTIPHSHPVLTLNTRTKNPLDILQTFVHEQMHWFVRGNSKYDEAISYLKGRYEDTGEFNTQKHPNSFWEHIVVCFNTRNILKSILDGKELEQAYSLGPQYEKTEKFVRENFDKIREEIESFGMIYLKY